MIFEVYFVDHYKLIVAETCWEWSFQGQPFYEFDNSILQLYIYACMHAGLLVLLKYITGSFYISKHACFYHW